MTSRKKFTIDLCNQIGQKFIAANSPMTPIVKELFACAVMEGLIPENGSLHFNLHLNVRVNDPATPGQEGVTAIEENILSGTFIAE